MLVVAYCVMCVECRSLLFVACCLLRVACCVLFVVWCLLCVVCCVRVDCWLRCVDSCALIVFTVYELLCLNCFLCVLFNDCCLLFVVCCSLVTCCLLFLLVMRSLLVAV